MGLSALQPVLESMGEVDHALAESFARLVEDLQARKGMKRVTPHSTSSESDPLTNLGKRLFTILPLEIQKAIVALPPDADLVCITQDVSLPWELLHNGQGFISQQRSFSRQLTVSYLPKTQLQPRKTSNALSVLIIANPRGHLSEDGDLPESSVEMERLMELADEMGPEQVHARFIAMHKATRQNVLEALASGEYDMIHYSGHARPDALLLADGELLGREIEQAIQGAPFLFLNACESGSLQGETFQPGDNQNNLVACAIQGGARGVLGTFWPIFDASSQVFSEQFYTAFFQGLMIGESVRQARVHVAKAFPDDPVWASYVLYGDPNWQWTPFIPERILHVTVLAIDLSTALDLTPKLQIEQRADLFFAAVNLFESVLTQHGGQLKMRGDASLTGVWGLDRLRADQDRLAIHAAMTFRQELDTLLSARTQGDSYHLPGMAIASGKAASRPSRDDDGVRNLYTYNPVLASAFELSKLAGPGAILVDEATQQNTRRFYLFEAPGSKESRHFRLSDLQRSQAVRSLVGRKRELRRLQSYYEDLLDGDGAVMKISGPVGIGKSRLLRDFYSKVGEKDARWVTIQCQFSEQTTAYASLSRLIYQLAGVDRSDDRNVIDGALVELCSQVDRKSSPATQTGVDCLSLLRAVTGIRAESGDIEEAEARQWQLKVLMGTLVQQAASVKPIILAIDDMQWMDEASLAVVDALLKQTQRAPLLVLALFRNNWVHDWPEGISSAEITLRELAHADSQELVDNLLAEGSASEKVADAILRFAGGAPLYIEEVVNALLETGQLQLVDGEWELAEGWQEVATPESIEKTIQTRIQRLDEPQRQVIEDASVVGQQFEVQILEEVKKAIPPLRLRAMLGDLENRGLLLPPRSQKNLLIYAFQHGLIHQSIYESLPHDVRARMHYLVGMALLHLYGSEQGHGGRIAEHFYRSHDRVQAIIYCLKAAAENEAAWANRTARTWYARALEKLDAFAAKPPTPSEQSKGVDADALRRWRIQALTGFSKANAALDEHDQAIAGFNEALALLEDAGPEAVKQQIDLYLNIATAFDRKGDYEAAHEALDRGLALTAADDRVNLGRLIIWKGMIYHRQGKSDEAIAAAEQGIAHLRAAQVSNALLAQAYNLRGILYRNRLQMEEAEASYQQARAIYESSHHLYGLTRVYNNLGVLWQDMGKWPEALEVYDKSLRISLDTGEVWWQAAVLLNKGEIYRRQGQFEEARDVLGRAFELSHQYDLGELEGLSLMNMAATCLLQGDVDEAATTLSAAKTYFATIDAQGHLVEIQRLQAELAMARGRWEDARRLAEEAQQTALETGRELESVHTQRILGAVYRYLGEGEVAEQALQASLQLAQEHKLPYEQGLALLELSLLYADNPKRQPDALATLNRAIERFQKLGATPALKAAQALRADLQSHEERGA